MGVGWAPTYAGGMSAQVVFVHGIRTSRTMWRRQVAHLEEAGIGARSLDLPGHGASSKDVGPGTIDSLAAIVIGFLDRKSVV